MTPTRLGYMSTCSVHPGAAAHAFFFFSSRRRHTRFSRDWSSDVCCSDLWFHELYQDHHPIVQHSMTVSGARDDLRYYLSGGLLDESGVFRYATDVYKKYNFRANLDFPVKSWLTVNNNLSYSQGDYDYPSLWGNSTDIWRYLAVTADGYTPATNPDGSWTGTGAYIGAFRDGGRGLTRTRLLQNKVSAEAALLGGRG